MIPRRVRIAILLAFLFHGIFILDARYRLSFDAYTHMLFAEHYAQDWFSLWETRWYTGFTVVSYPPLTHQLIALFVPMLGFDRAFALVLWVVTGLYPAGIYAFSRIFTGKTAASYAALATAVLLPIYVTAYIFGQLPFLTSTLTALFAAASLDRFLREGGYYNFALSVSLVTTSMAMHHATLMVHPFLIFALMVRNILRPGQPAHVQWYVLFKRLFIFVVAAIVTCSVVIFPFWQWGMTQTLQTPIDHPSRHNFFQDPLAPVIFFFPLYGPFLAVIPFLFFKWPPRFLGLRISFAILFLLGLGGTTPLPRLFFGKAWEWLTYDRFAFWACLLLTPFFGVLMIKLRHGFKNRFIFTPIPVTLRRSHIAPIVFSLLTATVLAAWFAPIILPSQPKPVDMGPIVNFLNENDNSQWRYLTFGFGDQFAYLNLLTTATTLDGSYHTARTIPELRESGIGQVDTSYWAPDGMQAIVPILRNSGNYGVRWGFVNPFTYEAVKIRWGVIHRSPFLPVLDALGWNKIHILENKVVVYENPNASIPASVKPPDSPPLNSFAWGVFPMLTLIAATSLGSLRVWPVSAEWVIRKVYSLTVSLIPLSLCFWVYRTIGKFPHPRVYFTYDHALFFLSDALVVLAVTLWLAVKISQLDHPQHTFSFRSHSVFLPFIGLCSLALLSVFWSRDWRLSLYLSLHMWLILLFVLSLRDWRDTWTIIMFGLGAALIFEAAAGYAGFAWQSTAFLEGLGMKWPGLLDISVPGASVVQLANGERLLRAYGTLPHPNILGGLVTLFLLGPAVLFISARRPNYAALMWFSAGIILLGTTFSRSAWLGLMGFALIVILKLKYLDSKRTSLLILAGALTLLLTMYPLRNFVFTRLGNTQVTTEQISVVGRTWLARQAVDMIRDHPLIGVGVGSFILSLADHAVQGALIEPVFNLILLVTSELGLAGFLLLIGLLILMIREVARTRTPSAILASATLTGFGVISMFDHYLWTLAPGRIMLGLAIGLWAGQVRNGA